jgi:asparaginyl-tRNA synthetase
MIEPGLYIRDIFTKPLGAQVVAHGWVKTRRDSKGIHFIQLNDGSSFQDLQVVIESAAIPESAMSLATTGACVRVS